MDLRRTISILCVVVGGVWSSQKTWNASELKFPSWFKFGAATAAHQIEGAWNVSGTYDFYGLNYYTSRLARRARPEEAPGLWPFSGIPELNIIFAVRPDWRKAPPFWFYIYPEGLRRQMKWLKDQYGDMEIIITESGVADTDGRLHDVDRVDYFQKHLEQVLLSIHEDRVNVTGFTAWTLLDDFEWIDGYNSKFGLYAVDFTDRERRRTPRASAFYYSGVVRTGSLILPPMYSPYTNSAGTKKTFLFTILLSLYTVVYF